MANLRNSSPRSLSTEEKPFTDAFPLYATFVGLPFVASTDRSPSADTAPPVTRIFTLSVKYGCTGEIGIAFTRTFAPNDGGSTEKSPSTETPPVR